MVIGLLYLVKRFNTFEPFSMQIMDFQPGEYLNVKVFLSLFLVERIMLSLVIYILKFNLGSSFVGCQMQI